MYDLANMNKNYLYVYIKFDQHYDFKTVPVSFRNKNGVLYCKYLKFHMLNMAQRQRMIADKVKMLKLWVKLLEVNK